MPEPFTRRQILDSSELKDFPDDNFKFDVNNRKFSKCVENIVGKGEIVRYEQFLLFPLFSKSLFCRQDLFGKGLSSIKSLQFPDFTLSVLNRKQPVAEEESCVKLALLKRNFMKTWIVALDSDQFDLITQVYCKNLSESKEVGGGGAGKRIVSSRHVFYRLRTFVYCEVYILFHRLI